MPRKKDRGRDDDWDRDFFGDMFGDFDEEFKRMNERIMRLFDSIKRNPEQQGTEGPYIYGFSFRQGPDGRPSFQEFGNVPDIKNRRQGRALTQDVREPMIDLNEDQKNVYITYELPGISKENIDLKLAENTVILSVEEGSRKYYKEVSFDFNLKAESVKAKFVNGILDVTIEKEVKKPPTGKRVDIE